MATLIVLLDNTVPVAADFMGNFTALNSEVRPAGTGGTGQSTYTTGDTLYASATNTLSRLAAGSTGNGLVMIAGVPAWRPVIVEQLTGLTLTNGVDATSDWDIAAGAATSEEATVATRMLMVNATTLTKQVDAAWTVGTNQGGLDTGAVANTTYHTHLIMRPDTGVVDAIFSLSATAPTMPTTAYTKSRRIHSFIRTGGVNAALHQYGDEFWYDTPPTLSTNAANPGTTAVTETMAIPIGVKFQAILNVVGVFAGSSWIGYLSSLDAADVAPSKTAAPLGQIDGAAGVGDAAVQCRVWTNTSAQIRSRLNSSAAGDVLRIGVLGWVDRRGRG